MRPQTNISQSKLKTWKYCPAGFYQQYILFLNPPNPHFMMGLDKHIQVEMYHKGLKDMVDRDGKKHVFNPEIIKDYIEAWPDPKFFDLVEEPYRGSNAVVLCHPETNEPLPPMSLVFDSVKTGVMIHDYKTSENSWSQNAVDDIFGEKGLQATIYCFAWWMLTGEILPFVYTVERKNPGPRTKPLAVLKTYRDISDFVAFWEETNKMLKDMRYTYEYPCTCWGREHKDIEVRLDEHLR